MSTAVIEKPKTELAQQQAPATLQAMLKMPAVQNQIAQALPTHCKPDRFLRVVANCLRRVPKLQECDQTSFFNCLLSLSQYGLEPDGRNAHLIPFRNNKLGITECQLIIDYKGLVELAMRSGLISVIHADIVCEEDDFEYDMGEVRRHKIDLRKPRGKAYAAYALVKFKDGATKCDVMSCEDVERIRKRSRAGNSGPWQTDWDEMAKKTVFRRLSKWISISAEFRDALDSDDDVIVVEEKPTTRIADLTQQFVPATVEPDPTDLNPQHDPAAAYRHDMTQMKDENDRASLLDRINDAAQDGVIDADTAAELATEVRAFKVRAAQ